MGRSMLPACTVPYTVGLAISSASVKKLRLLLCLIRYLPVHARGLVSVMGQDLLVHNDKVNRAKQEGHCKQLELKRVSVMRLQDA